MATGHYPSERNTYHAQVLIGLTVIAAAVAIVAADSDDAHAFQTAHCGLFDAVCGVVEYDEVCVIIPPAMIEFCVPAGSGDIPGKIDET